jgi:hypothetical protein
VTIQQMQDQTQILFLLFLVKLRGEFVGSDQNNQPKRIFAVMIFREAKVETGNLEE